MGGIVEPVALPAGALITRAFERCDYADAYRARLPAGAPRDLDALARVALGSAPSWVRVLMALRDRLVRPLGLKTSPPNAYRRAVPALEPGARLGLFRVYARTTNELLLGEDDRHLDFRLSLLCERGAEADWIVVSTVVRFNSWLGRAYFVPVRPLHRLIVPAMLRRGLRAL